MAVATWENVSQKSAIVKTIKAFKGHPKKVSHNFLCISRFLTKMRNCQKRLKWAYRNFSNDGHSFNLKRRWKPGDIFFYIVEIFPWNLDFTLGHSCKLMCVSFCFTSREHYRSFSTLISVTEVPTLVYSSSSTIHRSFIDDSSMFYWWIIDV